MRVCRKAVVIISNGTPDKRLPFLESFKYESDTISSFELELNSMSHLINVLRTELKDKPLSYALKDPELLKKALGMVQETQQRRREQEERKDPRKRLLRLMMKAAQMKLNKTSHPETTESTIKEPEVKSE